jgi:hypothetical protein
MSRDDMEQLEYIENWKKKQEEKVIRKENKKRKIKMNYKRSKTYFKLGFKCLLDCVNEVFKR